MEEFSFSTRIFFGEGALERLRRVQDKKVMIVTDRFMAGIGVPDKVAGHLTRCQVSVFDGVVPDPPIEVVAAGVQALQDCGAEVMIAVGGGSTIDAATAIRAAAIDQGAARLMGINVDRIIALVFLIGPGLGGVAGVMVGLTYGQISFDMGFSYGLKAFTAAILGGIGNIPGAMLGGMLLGLIETLGAAYLTMAWKDALSFLVLILILIIRPTGILGERVAEKL